MYQFDCPQTFIDLAVIADSNSNRSNQIENVIDPYFLTSHPSHDRQSSFDDEYSNNVEQATNDNDKSISNRRKSTSSSSSSSNLAPSGAVSMSTTTSTSATNPKKKLNKITTQTLNSSIASSTTLSSGSSLLKSNPRTANSIINKNGKQEVNSKIIKDDIGSSSEIVADAQIEISKFTVPVMNSSSSSASATLCKNNLTSSSSSSDSNIASHPTTMQSKLEEYRNNKKNVSLVSVSSSQSNSILGAVASTNNIVPSTLMPSNVNINKNVDNKATVIGKRERAHITSSSQSAAIPAKKAKTDITNNQKKSSAQNQSANPTINTRGAKKNVTSAKDSSQEDDLTSLLKAHNKRFAATPQYEPSRHSVRDVRKWEKLTGKLWANLSPEEREQANSDISKLKEN